MTCSDVREQLLDHVYGALEPAAERHVQAHLDVCADCRAALSTARHQSRLLGDAARIAAPELSFDTPTTRPGRIFTRGRLALAAAVLAAVTVGGIVHRGIERRSILQRYPIVAVQGPRSFQSGAPAEFLVRSTGVVTAQVYRSGKAVGDEIAAQPGADGSARIRVDVPDARPGETLQVGFSAAAAPGGSPERFTLPLRDATRLVTRVGTDKPLYRPGDTVRVRAVALEGFRLTPAGDTDLRVQMFDPRGAVVLDHRLPTLSGVTAWHHVLPENAPGGAYRLLVSAPQLGDGGNDVGTSERTFVVRSYRVPRLRFDVELDRDSYGPGGEGEAFLAVERLEGGVPAGAEVDAIVRVDGAEISRETLTLPESGKLSVPFHLPAEITEGRGQLALVVKDGGNVETSAKTIPILLGRVDVELFPEGGDLVAGLPGRVYFRARTPAGEPADLEARLLDGDDVVATATVDALGMGAFDLTPRAGARYRVEATKPADVDVNVDVPAVRERGLTLRTGDLVAAAGGPLTVRVASTTAGRHQIVATCRGAQIAQASVELTARDPRDVSLLPVTRAGGVVRITVFDPSGAPVAERLLSREPGRTLAVDVATAQPRYAPREHVKVNIVARDENGAPARAILGVSVVDEGVLSLADDEDTAGLAQHFLLGMEVEELEKAELFANGPDAALAVDRLLGVQGWRRFAWRDAATFVTEHPESGPRVVAVGNDETPQSWSNAGQVESRVRSHMRRVDQKLGGMALGLGYLVLVVGGFGVGVVSAVRRRPLPTVIGFGISFLLVGGLFTLARVGGGMGAPVAAMAPVDAARARFAGDAGAPEMEGAPREAIGLDGPAGEELRAQERRLDDEDAQLAEQGRAVLDELKDLEELDKNVAGGRFRGPRGEIPPDSRDPSDAPPIPLPAGPMTPGTGDDDDGGPMMDARRGDRKRWAKRNVYRYFAHQAGPATGARDDFAEVLYWHPLLVTDEAGHASFEFDTPDSVTTFRVSVEGHDVRGALTDATTTFENRIPFYVEPKFPVELSAGDELHLPVVVANDTADAFAVGVSLGLSGDLLRATDGAERQVMVPAGARGRALLALVAAQGQGTVTLDLAARGLNGLEDRTERTIPIVPRGYPRQVNESGVLEGVDGVAVNLPDDLNRFTLEGSLRLYPSTLSTLVDGLESMLRSPGGCFEQASSSNYPNVMVLNYLSEQEAVEPAVARRAKELLDRGYQLLTGYECGNLGYEWFGGDPGHEALTAYGLMEFVDMERVYDVDMEMVGRTRDWLMKRRDGKGGFLRNDRALDSFGAAPQETTDAYIVWAITEADDTVELTKELGLLEERAVKSDDPYLIALASIALANRGSPGAKKLTDRLASLQGEDGRLAGTTTSITSSRGPNLDVETTALAALAFTRQPARAANAQAAVRFLLESRRGGGFGATQATILALRALIEHAKASRKTASAHDLTILVNGEEVAQRHVAEGESGIIVFDTAILDALRPGENDVEVKTSGAETLPWSLALRYHTDLPASDPDCPVGITATLDADTVAEGETVGLGIVVTNRTAEGLPMTLARVGLPAGLEPRADQLEELRKSGAVGFYETRPREVTLYFRDMAPNAEKRIDLDLVAAIPGRFEGPATSAYLYYGDDQKDWAAPLRITIPAAE